MDLIRQLLTHVLVDGKLPTALYDTVGKETSKEWAWLLRQSRVLAYIGRDADLPSILAFITHPAIIDERLRIIFEFVLSDRNLSEVSSIWQALVFSGRSAHLLHKYERLSLLFRRDVDQVLPVLGLSQKGLVSNITPQYYLTWRCRHSEAYGAKECSIKHVVCTPKQWIEHLDDDIIFGNEADFIRIFGDYYESMPENASLCRYISMARSEGMVNILKFIVPLLIPKGITCSYWSYRNLTMGFVNLVRKDGGCGLHLDLPFGPRNQEHVECLKAIGAPGF